MRFSFIGRGRDGGTNWLRLAPNLLGSVSILLGAVWTCEQQVRWERRHIRTLHNLADALEAMERALRLSAPPMEELLREAVSTGQGEASRIFDRLSLETLDIEAFSVQWKTMASDNTLYLIPDEIRIFERPGTVLGRCGADEQCACLADSVRELRRCARQREEALAGQRRLWYTLSLSAALLVVVMLI